MWFIRSIITVEKINEIKEDLVMCVKLWWLGCKKEDFYVR